MTAGPFSLVSSCWSLSVTIAASTRKIVRRPDAVLVGVKSPGMVRLRFTVIFDTQVMMQREKTSSSEPGSSSGRRAEK